MAFLISGNKIMNSMSAITIRKVSGISEGSSFIVFVVLDIIELLRVLFTVTITVVSSLPK